MLIRSYWRAFFGVFSLFAATYRFTGTILSGLVWTARAAVLKDHLQALKEIVATGRALKSEPTQAIDLAAHASRNSAKRHVSMLKANAFPLAA